MKALAQIDFACNDPDNGDFNGEVVAIQYQIDQSDHAEIEPIVAGGYPFGLNSGYDARHGRCDWLCLHGSQYRFDYHRDWNGNWCWNAYWLPRNEAKRLLKDLRDSGRWRCTCAPTRFYDWFNRENSTQEAA